MEFINGIVYSINNEYLSEYSDLFLKYIEIGGPLFGIILPMVESFFPVLPLVGFVIINVGVFGFFWGYIYSWIGTCIGSFLLFLLIKKIGGEKFQRKIETSKHRKTLEKIRKKNVPLLFFLYCFPFTPSFLISGAAALANMNTKEFLLILIPSKLIMMISLSFIGVNISSFLIDPLKSIIFVLVIILVNLITQKIFEHYEKKHKDK